MKAVVISRPGPPEVLELRDVAPPVPQGREVLVRVKASALNRADLLQRVGRYPPPPGVPKEIPGIEFAGEVVASGAEATRWHPGDRVFGLVGGGAHAELLVADERTVARIPDSVGWREAAAFPEAFITAFDAMVSQAEVREGERVLIHAVASGVGLAAVQVARAWGAVPFGTSRTEEKLAAAIALGLESGVAIRESPDEVVAAVQRWTDGGGMHVILDLVGGSYVAADVDAAAPRGRIMLIGAVAGGHASLDVRRILSKRLLLRGTVLRSRSLDERIAVTEAFAAELVPRLAGGALRPTIDSLYPLDRIADAHAHVESNATVGKVVIAIDGTVS